MKRADLASYVNAPMWYKGVACEGDNYQQLCCPIIANALMPTCGWYGFNNGNCESKCPDGMVEVGSDATYCSNNDNAVACCTADTPATQLYSQCDWGCDTSCPSDHSNQLFDAKFGSGAAICRPASLDRDKKCKFRPFAGQKPALLFAHVTESARLLR